MPWCFAASSQTFSIESWPPFRVILHTGCVTLALGSEEEGGEEEEEDPMTLRPQDFHTASRFSRAATLWRTVLTQHHTHTGRVTLALGSDEEEDEEGDPQAALMANMMKALGTQGVCATVCVCVCARVRADISGCIVVLCMMGHTVKCV